MHVWDLQLSQTAAPRQLVNLTICQATVKGKTFDERIFFLFQPFTQTVWLLLLATIFVHGLVTYTIERNSAQKNVASAKMSKEKAEDNRRETIRMQPRASAISRNSSATEDEAVTHRQEDLEEKSRKLKELGRENIYHSCKCAATKTLRVCVCTPAAAFLRLRPCSRAAVRMHTQAPASCVGVCGWIGERHSSMALYSHGTEGIITRALPTAARAGISCAGEHHQDPSNTELRVVNVVCSPPRM